MGILFGRLVPSPSIVCPSKSSYNVKVASVKVYVNDNLISTLTSNHDDWSVNVTLPRSTNTIKVISEDTSGTTNSESIYVFYDDDDGPPQRAPVLNSISNTSINEGVSKTITARATDSNGDTIRYSLSSSPLWVSINSNNGVITISAPTELSSTSYSVTVRATNNDGYDSESFRITINEINQFPILSSIGVKSVTELLTLSFTVSASDSDLPALSLSYVVNNPPTGSNIHNVIGEST